MNEKIIQIIPRGIYHAIILTDENNLYWCELDHNESGDPTALIIGHKINKKQNG